MTSNMKHVFTMFFVIVVILGTMFIVTYAFAADLACGPAAPMIKALETKYHETLHIKGAAKLGVGMKLYANSRTKSWTFMLQNGDFLCLLASGEKYEVVIEGTAL